MKKWIITTMGVLAFSNVATAQNFPIMDSIKKNVDINFLLRSSLEFSSNDANQNGFRQNESRMQVTGKILDGLGYNVRVRLNRLQAPNSLDNAPSSLDEASLDYTFGDRKEWTITVGKQGNHFGNWEFEKNLTFEYQYSDLINKQVNLFAVGAELIYRVSPNHSFDVFVYNAKDDNFATIHSNTKFSENGLKASSLPLGANIAWKGNFADNKFRTSYSLGTSQVAKGKTDFQIALGNKLVLDRFEAYFDLQHANIAVDYSNMISSVLNSHHLAQNPAYTNVYAQKIVSQSAVARLDYAITPKWYITGKTIYERINGDSKLGNNLSQHYINLIGLEYKPFKSEDFKIFGYYANNYTKYHNKFNMANPNQNTFAVGFLYFLNAL